MANGNFMIDLGASVRQALASVPEASARAENAAFRLAGGFEEVQLSGIGASDALDRLASTISNATAVAEAGQGLVGFATDLQRIVGIFGVAQSEVDEMGAALRRMAPEVARGPGELADALLTVTAAGARGQDALDVVRESARATAVGLGSTAAIADTVTRAIDAYGAANLDAGRAVGILVGAVREGAAADGLATALRQALPVAAQLGVGLDEVGAAVAFLTRNGLSAGQAIAGLRGLFVALLQPSEQAKVALSGAGESFEDVRSILRERGLLPALEALREALGNDEQALARAIPEFEGLNTALALTGAGADEARAIFAALARDGVGTLDKAFAAVADTAEFRFQAALAKTEAAAVELAGNALPILTFGLRVASAVMDELAAVIAGAMAWRIAARIAGWTKAFIGATKAARGATWAMRALNVVLGANPLVRIASIVAAVGIGLASWAVAADDAAEGMDHLANSTDAVAKAEARRARLASLESQLAEAEKKLRAVEHANALSDYSWIGLEPPAVAQRKEVARLRAEIAELRKEIAEAESFAVEDTAIEEEHACRDRDNAAPAADPAAARQTALARVRAHEDALARLRLSRIELTRREEAAALEEYRVQAEAAGLTALQQEHDRTAIVTRYAAERAAIRDEEMARDIKRERAAAEERRRFPEAATLGAEERRRAQLERDDPATGAATALRNLADEAGAAGRNAADAVTGSFRAMGNAVTEFVTTGELEFGKFTDSIIADMARIAVRQTLVAPLAQGFAGALGSLFGGAPAPAPAIASAGNVLHAAWGAAHGGGVAGAFTGRRDAALLTRGGTSAGLPEAGMRRRFRGRGALFRGGPWSAVRRPVRRAFMGQRSNERRGTAMPERGTARRAGVAARAIAERPTSGRERDHTGHGGAPRGGTPPIRSRSAS